MGGTWYHDRYPGSACDIPSHLYSFSFEAKRDWSRPYAPQPEIPTYLEQCAEKYGLLPHCRFGDAVRRARWDEAAAEWTLETASGRTVPADVVVTPSASSTTSPCPASPASPASTPSLGSASTPRHGAGSRGAPAYERSVRA